MASNPALPIQVDEPTSLVRRTFGAVRFHTDGEILALAYDRDGRIWSVEEPGVLRSWNETGRSLSRHFLVDLETSWTFAPDARRLVAACDDLLIYEIPSGQLLARVEVPSWVTAVAFDPTSSLVATGHDDGVVRIWDTQTEEMVAEFCEHSLPVSAIAFSADGKILASAGEDREIRLWDRATGRLIRTMKGHTDRIPAIAWHPSGELLVSVGWDSTARVWDVRTGEPRILLNTHDDQVEVLAFSPHGELLATSDSASVVHIWGDLLSGKALNQVPGFADEIRALAFREDGQRLLVGGTDRVIHVYEPNLGQLIAGRPSDAHHSIALWFDGQRNWLVSNAAENGLRIWDLETAAQRPSPLPNADYLHVAASPNGRWLVGITSQPELVVWDSESKTLRMTDGPRTAPTYLVISPDSSSVAAAVPQEGTAWIWDLATLEPRLIVIEATEGSSVEALAWHPNGKWLLCGGIDFLSTGGSSGAVCLWDLQTKMRIASIPHGATTLAIDASGNSLAFAAPEARVFVHAMGSAEPALELRAAPNHRIDALTFTSNGDSLLATGDDDVLRVWNAQTGELLAERELPGPVHALIARPDGTLLAAAANATVLEMMIQS